MRQHRHEWSFVGFLEIDLVIGLGVFDFRQLTVLGDDARGVGVVEIVDRFPALGVLDAIFDAIVETRSQRIDSFITHAAFELHQDFGTAEAASFTERNLFGGGRLLFLSSGHDPHVVLPLFPPPA